MAQLSPSLLILILTQVKVVVEVGLEKVLKINFHGWEGVAWWLDQVGKWLSQSVPTFCHVVTIVGFHPFRKLHQIEDISKIGRKLLKVFNQFFAMIY